MDEENKQITGNGVYSYGEQAAESEEKPEQTEQIQPVTENENKKMTQSETSCGESEIKEPSQSETSCRESEIKEPTYSEHTAEERRNDEMKEEKAGTQDSAQTESGASQENKFAYQDNHYDYSQQYHQSNSQSEHLDNAPMDLKDWILTLVVLLIPCVGIVMYFVWAFGNSGNINRRNFCRAQLIIFAVLMGIYLVFFVLFGAVAFTGAALY